MTHYLIGDSLTMLRLLDDECAQCCVTSPPYWGLRDYGVEGQLGLEKTPEEYVAKIVEVFREVRRVLRKDGTLWLNLGDSYNGQGARSPNVQPNGDMSYRAGGKAINIRGLKPKDLVGIPWMVAFALRADGWYLRQDIIWSKPNPMPESVRDRCTKSHEYVFLLSKSAKYYYDADAIKEPVSGNAHARGDGVNPKAKAFGPNSRVNVTYAPKSGQPQSRQNESFSAAVKGLVDERNKRSVWTVGTQAYPEAHFATYPEKLIAPMILAGCPEGGMVLDPFGGSGTTAAVALSLGRNCIHIDLNPDYLLLAKARVAKMEAKLLAIKARAAVIS